MKFRFKKIMFLLLVLEVCIFFAPAYAEESQYDQALKYLYNQEIVQSLDKKANEKMTQAEFFTMTLRSVGLKAEVEKKPIPSPFTNVKPTDWFSFYLVKAYRLELITKEKVNPNASVRFIDALSVLLQLEGYPTPVIYKLPFNYKDLRTNQEKKVAAKAIDLGVYKPSSEKIFGAQKVLTREELVLLLYRFALIGDADQALQENNKNNLNITISSSNLKNVEYLESVKSQVFSKYYKPEELDETKLMDSAIDGYVKGIGDKYSVYFPPVDSKDFGESLDGSFEGIGAYLEETDQGVVIQTPIQGAPADKAGVKAGDIIKKVNDEDVSGLHSEEVVKKIKGPKGTSVKIEFLRNGQAVTITIVRDRVEIKSIESFVQDNVLIIKMNQFGANTGIEFSDAITEKWNPQLRGIILDLRSNPGGFLNIAEDILSYWIDEKEPVVQLLYKNHTQEELASKNQKLFGVKTAILINKASASASEIVAGSLKDAGAATIFGETSFGKGSVQELIQYTNGGLLKLTVAEWRTGAGTKINGLGVTPNVEVQDDPKTISDEVLETAKNSLR